MAYPEVEQGTQVCVTATKEGINVYGNRQAFRSLSKMLSVLADSVPSEHEEVHLFWHLTSYAAKAGKEPSNVWALFDRNMLNVFGKPFGKDGDFELTFMVVEQRDLDKLAENRDSQLLPDNWNTGST